MELWEAALRLREVHSGTMGSSAFSAECTMSDSLAQKVKGLWCCWANLSGYGLREAALSFSFCSESAMSLLVGSEGEGTLVMLCQTG